MRHKVAALIIVALFTTGCGPINPIDFIMGSSGPEINATAVVGENVDNTNATLAVESAGDDIDAGTVNISNADPLLVLLLVLGWLLPSPAEIGNGLLAPFRWIGKRIEARERQRELDKTQE